MAEPTQEELRELINKLVLEVDLNNTGIKTFTKHLSSKLGGVNLKPHAAFIRQALSDAVNAMEDGESGDESSEEEEEEKEAKPKPKKGLSVKKEISDKLAGLLGQGKLMARTEIVKALWDYIKENNLQNPDNKREILLDDAMQQVFGCKSFTMFEMNKYIGAHVHPFKPVDLTKSSTQKKKKKKRKQSDDGSPPAKKKRKAKKPGLQPPYRLSDELAEVVGKSILPRPQVVTALWAYIKENDLQNPDDKREIICDKKLKAIMGGNKRVTMFSMNKHITPHLLEKLDRSEYTHEVEESSDKQEEEEEEEDDSQSSEAESD